METEKSHVGDQHWGRGGRYVVVDGKRQPREALVDGDLSPATTDETASVVTCGAATDATAAQPKQLKQKRKP